MAKKTAKKKADQPGFDESLEQLQEIVVDLEEGALGLEEAMARFEAGVGLLKTCYATLSAAEQRIEVLTGVDESGEIQSESFDASSTVSERKGSAGRRTSKKTTEDASEGDTLF